MKGKDLVEVASSLEIDKYKVQDHVDRMRRDFNYGGEISTDEVYIFVKLGHVGLNEVMSLALDYALLQADRNKFARNSQQFIDLNKYYRQRVLSLSSEFIRGSEGKRVPFGSLSIESIKNHVKKRIDL